MTYNNLARPGFLRANHRPISHGITTRVAASVLPWIATAVCMASQAHAQAPSPTPALSGSASPTLLQEVVVTATRTDETAANVTSSYTKLDGDEIERTQIPDLKKAVDLSPGVFSRENGAEGGTTAISIRGNRSVDTLTLVDGVKADSVMFGNGGSPFLSFASNLNLEDVEIVRGPQSSLYGPEAMGGVVSVETKRGQGTPTSTLFFEGGSYNTYREGLFGSGSLGPLDYSFHYAREDTGNNRANNNLDANSGSLRLDYTVSDQLTVGMTFRNQNGLYHEPGSDRSIDSGFNDPNARCTEDATIVSTYAEWKVSDIWTTKLTLGTYQERYVYNNPFNPASYLGTYTPVSWNPDDWSNSFIGSFGAPAADYSNTKEHSVMESANWFADWKNTIDLTEKNRLLAGASLLYQTGHYEYGDDYTVSNPYVYNYKYNQVSYGSAMDFGLYAEDQWKVIDNLTLSGGLRYDHDQLDGDGTESSTSTYGGSLLHTPYNINADELTYRLGAAYLVEPTHTKIHTSLGTGFKEPTIYQLSTSSFANGNTLEPERSQSWDAGVTQYFLGDQLSLDATFFHSHINNLITYLSQTSPKQGYYINSDEANSHGIETAATAKINDHWQARLAYTWTESEQSAYCWDNVNEITLTGMQRALRIPRHLFNADTNYTFDLPVGKLTLGVGATLAMDRQDVDWGYSKPVVIKGQTTYAGEIVNMPDYLTARVYAKYAMNERFAFTTRVENVTNKDYQPVLGYPALGRAYYGGFEITF